MQPIITTSDLREAILQLEREQEDKGRLLKEQFLFTYESMKPVNLIKGALKDITTPAFLIDNVLGTAVGLGTGLLSKKIIVGASANLVRKVIGSVLQFGVSRVVAQHQEGIKTIGKMIFRKVFRKKGNEHLN